MPTNGFIVNRLDAEGIVCRLEAENAVALPLLRADYCAWLVQQAQMMPWRAAQATVGQPPDQVLQRMEVCEHFPPDSVFLALVGTFQSLCDQAFAGCQPYPFEAPLRFNDLMLQRYAVGDTGITPHRDRTHYRNLIVLFVLAGVGRFRMCTDRSANQGVEIPNVTGDAILIRAPGFSHSTLRPFHALDRIQSRRYVFGLRHDRSKPFAF